MKAKIFLFIFSLITFFINAQDPTVKISGPEEDKLEVGFYYTFTAEFDGADTLEVQRFNVSHVDRPVLHNIPGIMIKIFQDTSLRRQLSMALIFCVKGRSILFV